MEASRLEEIRVLGPLEIVGPQRAATLPALKERQLLAALLVEPGTSRSTDALVDALWGASPPPSAPKLLHVYVSKLRKLLPSSARIRRLGSGYVLELDNGVLDAGRFEDLVAQGRQAARDNPALAASVLRRALSMWRGQAYGDLAYDDFVRAEAERLEELRLAALEERFDAELALARHAEVLPEVLSAANANPLRERLQAQAMLALYRSGRQSEALERYASTRKRLHHDLGLEPSAELRDLQKRVLRHDPTLTSRGERDDQTRATVGASPNALLGRERELDELRDLLRRDDVRLLVLTGAGGSGKTRLAFEAARQCSALFANGAAFVELAPIQDPELLVTAIANAVGVERLGDRPLVALVDALRAREMLMLLDNFEHLRDGGPVLVELLSRAPRLTLLVTSRVVLHLSGEHVYPVEPLRGDAAAALFLERARRADARFELDADAEQLIAQICRRLDGLPLAIELAAGRIRTLTPAELLSALEQRLPLLTGGPRDLPARQQTLRATLEWSYDLLDDRERRGLVRLSVFAGGWTLEAAEAVCDTTLERLCSLVDHNLVVRTVTPSGSRYSMLETIREFAQQQLEASGEADAVRRGHAEWILGLVKTAHLSEDDDEPFDLYPSVALTERENIRTALDWAAEADVLLGLELASSLEMFFGPHAPAEGVRRISAMLAAATEVPPRLRARALRNLAGAAHQLRDYEFARPSYDESLRIFTDIGDTRGAASVRTRLAYLAWSRGELALARTLLAESERDAKHRFPLIETQNALLLAHVALTEGAVDDAEIFLKRSQQLATVLSWSWYESVIEHVCVELFLQRGDLDAAERHGRAAVAIAFENEYVLVAVQAIVGLARVALGKGDLERAGLLWAAALAHGKTSMGSYAERWARELRKETRPAFVAAVARGAELEVWAAAAVALGDQMPAATNA